MEFEVDISEGENGWFVAECPSLPGCVSQGKNLDEVVKNIKEAIALWIETAKDMKRWNKPVPKEIKVLVKAVL